MLEILAIYGLCKFIGNKAREKGLPALIFQILIAIAFICGEIGGLIIGVAIGSILVVALPEVFQSLVDVMNDKINTIG